MRAVLMKCFTNDVIKKYLPTLVIKQLNINKGGNFFFFFNYYHCSLCLLVRLEE